MDPSEAPSPNLGALVRSAVWPALLDVRDRVRWAIEIVDTGLTPMCSGFGGRTGTRAGRVLSTMTTPALRAAVRECLTRLETTFVLIGPLTIGCVPIAIGRRALGAVLVADDDHPSAADTRARMARFGSGLARALEAHLTSPAANRADSLRQLSALIRILRRAAATGVEQDVVRSFIEALSVWEDLEAWGYRGTLHGPFVRETSLPGSASGNVPREIRRESIASLSEPAVLGPDTAGELGFKSRHGVVIVPIKSEAAGEWLIVFPRTAETPSESTLPIYCDLLGPSLDDVAALEALRLTWAMVEHLLPGPSPDSFEEAARKAVQELASAVKAPAWLTVTTADGGQVLTAGEAPPSAGQGEEVSVSLEVGPACRATLGLRPVKDAPATRREVHLLRAAGETLGPWIKTGAVRLAMARERRVLSRTFDQLVERQARHAATRRDDVSVIVIALGKHAQLAELAHAWIGEIRRNVRPTDMTGRLSSGDIGILLLETPPRRAQFVADRIQRLIATDHGFGKLPDAGVGVAGWSGHQPPGSVVVEASARAAAGTPGREPGDSVM